jgi:nicotinamide-nucleotide amidase
MHAEIIAVGTELTTGAKLDTNSQWLSLELAAVGIPVKYHTTVADDLEAMLGVLRDAVNRSDVVLVTGGLGPTLDDLTRDCMAELVQAELVLHEPSLEFIKSLFAHRKREMPERNAVQAMFPEGSTPLANPRGSAPGIWMEVPRKGSPIPCQLAAMPGVPSEMKRMFQREVLPRLPAGGAC